MCVLLLESNEFHASLEIYRLVRSGSAIEQFLIQEIGRGREEFSVSELVKQFSLSADAIRSVFTKLVRSGQTPEDFVDVVDENGNLSGTIKAWSAVHRDGNWHLTVQGLVKTEEGFYIIRRATGIDEAGKLDTTFGGGLLPGDSFKDSALWEGFEELGIELVSNKLKMVGEAKVIGQSDIEEEGFKEGIFFYRTEEGIYNREISQLFVVEVSDSKLAEIKQYLEAEGGEIAQLIGPLSVGELLKMMDDNPERFADGIKRHRLNLEELLGEDD